MSTTDRDTRIKTHYAAHEHPELVRELLASDLSADDCVSALSNAFAAVTASPATSLATSPATPATSLATSPATPATSLTAEAERLGASIVQLFLNTKS